MVDTFAVVPVRLARVSSAPVTASRQAPALLHHGSWPHLGPVAGLAGGLVARVRAGSRRSVRRAGGSTSAVLSSPATEQLPCVRGVLPNGLRYVILEHAVPKGRFEAHLEFHVGSVDEEDHQQGMAHMLEHVCFLGSERRTELQGRGIGMTSNALTDFQHTVYHINLDVGHVAEGLDCLVDVGFTPAFAPERVEKERAAVLNEAQMVNNVHYRLQTQILGAVHQENPIHRRFPIGLEGQIASWTRDDLLAFHRRWYSPENATLYLVGDLAAGEAEAEVLRAFGSLQGAGIAVKNPWATDAASIFRPFMPSRPSVLHDFIDLGDSGASEAPGLHAWSSELKVSVASNDLLQGTQICWATKSPMRAAADREQLLQWLCERLVVEVVRLRLQTRWCANAVPCNFHAYDSLREGAAVTTLTVMTEPSRWRSTCVDVLQEVHAVCRYGIVDEELALTQRLLLDRVVEAARAQPWAFMGTALGYGAAATSREVAEALIVSSPCGHLFTQASDFSEALQKASARVNLSAVNVTAERMLKPFGGASHCAGAVVVSCPGFVSEEHTGRRVPYTMPSVDEVRAALSDVPALTEEEVRSKRISVPSALLPRLDPLPPLERKVLPGGVVALLLPNGLRVRLLVQPGSPDGPTQSTMRLIAPGGKAADVRTGACGSLEAGLLALQNSGIGEWSREQVQLFQQVNSVEAELRPGAHVSEVDVHFTPSPGSRRAALEWLHWLLRDPQMSLKSFNDAQIRMKGNAHAREKSLEGRAEQVLLQQMYPRDQWLWAATLQQTNELTLGGARRAVQTQFGDLSGICLNIAASAAAGGGLTGAGGSSGLSHDEDTAVGGGSLDASSEEEASTELRSELEREVCGILGALPGNAAAGQPATLPGPEMASQGCELRVHVPDAEERALVLVGGGAPSYWGQGDATWQASAERKGFSWGAMGVQLLYPALAMQLMLECMNGRLLSRVRDQLSLSYSCSAVLTLFHDFDGGHFVCKAFASPDRLARATLAVMQVLRSPSSMPFLDQEVEAAKKVMAYRETRDKRERGFLVGKMRSPPGSSGASVSLVEERSVRQALSADDAQLAWESLSGLDDPFVVLASSGLHAPLVPEGLVERRRPAPPSAQALSTPDLAMLD